MTPRKDGRPDLLFFRGGCLDGDQRGWKGDWPPPDEFVGMVGPQSGYRSLAEPVAIDDEAKTEFAELGIVQTRYRLRSWSKLPDTVASPHVARCAEYAPAKEGE